jgi:hypothetical protein
MGWKRAVVAIVFVAASAWPAIAEDRIILFAGPKVPEGWADAFTYSLRTLAKCRSMIATIPDTASGKVQVRCIVKVDPGAKDPPPMS